MALLQPYRKYNTDFNSAYWRVISMKGNNTGIAVEVAIFSDPLNAQYFSKAIEKQPRTLIKDYTLDTKTYQFDMTNADLIVPASSTVFNFAYLLLKTLPEFSNAVDV